VDRRQFFKAGFTNVTKSVVEEVERRAEQKAQRFIRPPFALQELDFLLACTRCEACIEACPHQVIFPLSAKMGVQEAATPALDLLNKGCHLCQEWPCVDACEAGALLRPECSDEEPHAKKELPRLARAEIDTQHCLPYSGPECGACKGTCPVTGAMTWPHERPQINTDLCTGCALCREACIVEPKAIMIRSLHQDDL
jgi:ferredoxin-type protein NapG